jgi:membrane fusion protein, copper/silver efflux system
MTEDRDSSREGRAPSPSPSEPSPSAWARFRMAAKILELRVRFVALMAVTWLVFGYWDTIENHVEKWARPPRPRPTSGGASEFYCPMHPNLVRDAPASCPGCGMPLSKRVRGVNNPLPGGIGARVALSPYRVAQAGIRTAEVGYAPLVQTVSIVGRVEYDGRRRAVIASRVNGILRVERVCVSSEGLEVTEGQPLIEVSSPTLLQAVRELLVASRTEEAAERARSEQVGGSPGEHRDLLRLPITKLLSWGITQGQIDELLRRGQTESRLPLLSPIRGRVTRLQVRQGQYVTDGEVMLEVSDLSRVWVQAQVFEDQLPLVREGEAVEATAFPYPGEVFRGTVAFFPTRIDPLTRTTDVRFELENVRRLLQHGMTATVTIATKVSELPAFRARRDESRARRGADLRMIEPTAEQQKSCPVTGLKLGSMGPPVAVEIQGRKIWSCCEACTTKLKSNPSKYLARLTAPPDDLVLAVPELSVIDTGKRKVVYVETEPGLFESREVVLGPLSGNFYAVLDGLAPGERVATAGAFLIDAETRLDPAAGAAYFGGSQK